MKGGLGRFLSRLQSRNALNFRILPQMRPQITPVKRVEILRLSTPYGNVGIVDSCNILLAVPENCPEKRCSLPEGT